MKKGFTLAEILITIAIIGIVASLTISPVAKQYKKQEYYTKFIKSYNTISKALQRAIVQSGNVQNWSKDDCLNLLNYLKIQKVCTDEADLDCLTNDAKHYKKISSGITGVPIIMKHARRVKTADGMGWSVSPVDYWENDNAFEESSCACKVTVDTNTSKNGPNVAGYDLFYLMISKDNKVQPYEGTFEIFDSKFNYSEKKANIKRQCLNNGATCAVLLLFDKKMDY